MSDGICEGSLADDAAGFVMLPRSHFENAISALTDSHMTSLVEALHRVATYVPAPEKPEAIRRAFGSSIISHPHKRQRTSDAPHSLGLLQLSRELCSSILCWCDGQTLRLVDCSCAALSCPTRSIVQEAVRLRCDAKYPSRSLGVQSWAMALQRCDQVHRAAVDCGFELVRDDDLSIVLDSEMWSSSSRTEQSFCASWFVRSLQDIASQMAQHEWSSAAADSKILLDACAHLLLNCTYNKQYICALLKANCLETVRAIMQGGGVKAQLDCVRAAGKPPFPSHVICHTLTAT